MIRCHRFPISCGVGARHWTQKDASPFDPYPDDPWRAAYRGDLEALEALQESGCDLLAPNEVDYTPLMAAVRGEHLNIVEFLLAKGAGAEADERGYTALHWAVAQPAGQGVRQAECVTALLAAGAEVNARGGNGSTPLMNAAWFGNVTAAAVLLRKGADPSLLDEKGRSAASLAKERGHAKFLELLQGKSPAGEGLWNKLLSRWRK